MNMTSGLTIEPKQAALGATVHGIDLGQAHSSRLVATLEQAWLRHLVLVFPEQTISDAQHIAFAGNFGALELHPSLAHRASLHRAIYRVSNVDEAGNLISPNNAGWQYLSQSWRWHTDSSFREIPSKGSILHGVQVTNEGGDTLFSNMYAAYDALDADTKRRIDGLWVIHDHDHILSHAPEGSKNQNKDAYETLSPVRHPLVRRHPSTRQKTLFLSPHTMSAVEGMNDASGRALLDELITHATRDTFVYRHVWREHDVIMWDNRCTMHSVQPFDNTRIRRVMHRVTLKGEEAPIPA